MTSNLPVRRGCLIDDWITQAYENAKLFKEKVKRWHDKRIQKREFNVGDYVLLFNSRLRFFAGKLLFKWKGPNVIEEVYCSGAIKINNFEGTSPRVVNGQRIKHYISLILSMLKLILLRP